MPSDYRLLKSILSKYKDSDIDFGFPSNITRLFLATVSQMSNEELTILFHDPGAGSWRKKVIIEEMRGREKTMVPYVDF